MQPVQNIYLSPNIYFPTHCWNIFDEKNNHLGWVIFHNGKPFLRLSNSYAPFRTDIDLEKLHRLIEEVKISRAAIVNIDV